jgi:hypothetical protein
MRKDGRTWIKEEPARQSDYRRTYLHVKSKLDNMEDSIDFIMEKLKKLEKRVERLEFKDHHQ